MRELLLPVFFKLSTATASTYYLGLGNSSLKIMKRQLMLKRIISGILGGERQEGKSASYLILELISPSSLQCTYSSQFLSPCFIFSPQFLSLSYFFYLWLSTFWYWTLNYYLQCCILPSIDYDFTQAFDKTCVDSILRLYLSDM